MELGPLAMPGPFIPWSFSDLAPLGGLGFCWKKDVGFRWNGLTYICALVITRNHTFWPALNDSTLIPSSTFMATPYKWLVCSVGT